MKQYNDLDRTESLKRLVPDLYDYDTVLYIGARSNRYDYADDFAKAGCIVDVLEIWEPNIKWLNSVDWVDNVIHADIITYNIPTMYDVIFFHHGPEHINMSKLPAVLKKIECAANKMVVLGCPWGNIDFGAIGGNPYEKHINFLDYPFFEDKGYTVECLGNNHQVGSNITAIKRTKRD